MNVYLVRSVCETELGGGRMRQIYPAVDRTKFEALDLIDDFGGEPYRKRWPTVKLALDKPKLKRADFLHLHWKVLVCNERAMSVVGNLLRASGELFPVGVAGEKEKYTLVNITRMLGKALDRKGSRWDGRSLRTPAFHPARIPPGTVLFKLPQDFGLAIYCMEQAPDNGFKALVEEHKLRGLEFVLVWSDQKRVANAVVTKHSAGAAALPAVKKVPNRALRAGERKDISDGVAEGYKALKLPRGTPPARTQKAIRDLIDQVVRGKLKLSSDERADLTVNLSCLWGQSLCEAAGWEWRYATLNGRELPVVTPQDRAHAVVPLHFVYRQISASPKQDNASLLLFKMITGKTLPAAPPGAFITVG